MKKKILLLGVFVLAFGITITKFSKEDEKAKEKTVEKLKRKTGKKTPEERLLFAKERELHELRFQINPNTGEIPLKEKEQELKTAEQFLKLQSKTTSSIYNSRGPSNLGGRTRAFKIDVSDPTGNTILAGGVSSGVFKTTDGGSSWTKVSSNSEIHNVTTIAQDPRPDSQNIWYYGTGEWTGNSATLGSAYRGQGIWKSIDSGNNWSKIAVTDSDFFSFDSFFDYINAIEVSPTSGDLFIATTGKVYRYDGTNMVIERELENDDTGWTDVKIASNGRVFVAMEGTSKSSGVTTSPTGNGSWSLLAKNGSPADWSSSGRIVLGVAPSNDNILYALYNNGKSSSSANYQIEADLWKYDLSTSTWTNYSDKLPDEDGGDSAGNDPFAIQGGYDLVVSVKPDDENFVVVGGTNAYKIEDITIDPMFTRIGGYINYLSYGLYNVGGTDHHPDIHQLVFDIVNPDIIYSGTDGGIHKADVTAAAVAWTSLNNNYQTYQYYHVAMDPEAGKDIVLGGVQDNGTTVGGLDYGSSSITDKTTMESMAGGDGVAVGIGRNGANLRYYLGFQNGTIFQLKNNFSEITPDGSSSQFVTYFYLDPDNNEHLYYAGLVTLYATNDAENITSSTWNNLGSLPTNEFIRTIATTRGTYNANSSYVFIGGESGGVFRVSDPQSISSLSTEAVNITPTSASTSSGTIVSGIAVHPSNPDILLVVYANYGINNIYMTTNATSTSPTWTLIERNLNNHSVRSAAIAEVDGKIIYFVGTARGLYSSSDPTREDWDIESPDKIGLAVVSSLVYRPSDHKLLIGTHGNGMFETTVDNTLSSDTFKQNSLGLSLYPNPVVREIQLKSDVLLNSEKITFNIYDISGKLVREGNVLNQKINVEALNSGVYIINVKSLDRQQSLKFVKK